MESGHLESRQIDSGHMESCHIESHQVIFVKRETFFSKTCENRKLVKRETSCRDTNF